MKSIYGTRGDDLLGDNAMPDAPISDKFYFGRSGNDEIVTAGGNDHLFGGKGDDHFLSMNEDSFVIHGGRGHDTLEIWIPSDFQITEITRGRDNLINHIVIERGDQVIDVHNVEYFVWHHEEML